MKGSVRKKNYCRWGLVAIIFVTVALIGGGAMAQNKDYLSQKAKVNPLTADDLKKLIPEQIAGWKAEDEDQVFNPETIFNYIDGAGEVYRSYNFRLLLARRFHQPEKPDLVVDLFDMGTSFDAFGVFTHDLEGEKIDIGQMGLYKGGLLSFWKDRFFVSVYAEDETPETKAMVLELGKAIASRIEREGILPDLLDFLPESELNKETIRYFHTHHILNYHFFVSEGNIFQLGPETEAVLAQYRSTRPFPLFLLLVRYPDENQALYAWNFFCRHYMPEAAVPGEIKVEDGTWTVTKVRGRLLAAVFQAATVQQARSLVESVIFREGGEK